MRITYRQLVKLGACEEQRELFRETFGTSVTVTEAVCREHGSKFSLDWVVGNLFSAEKYAEYWDKLGPIDAEYRAKLDPIYAEYQAKLDPIYAEYRAKLAMAFCEVATE